MNEEKRIARILDAAGIEPRHDREYMLMPAGWRKYVVHEWFEHGQFRVIDKSGVIADYTDDLETRLMLASHRGRRTAHLN